MKVIYNHPHLPKGAKVAVTGLGMFENGVERSLTPKEAKLFKPSAHLKTVVKEEVVVEEAPVVFTEEIEEEVDN